MADAGLAVVADEMWGRDCLAYNVQGRFSDEAVQAIGALQDDVRDILPAPVHVCPPHALHVSIAAPVSVRWPDHGKDAYWQDIAAGTLADLEGLCRSQRRFALHLTTLRVTPSAIIAVADYVPALVGAIRARFAQAPGHPSLPRPVYDIAHTTIARFSAGALLPEPVVRRISARPVALAACVARIELVRERVYPSLETDTLASFELSPAEADRRV